MSIAKRPLPTKEDAVAFAREMVPKAKWASIVVEEGSTEQGGDGIILQDARECWIISYDPSPEPGKGGEERVWVDKATGVVVKMSLED